MPIQNALTVDVEDYFQVSVFADNIDRRDWDKHPLRVENNTRRLLDLLEDLDVTLVYVGQLERSLHPDGARKMDAMAIQGLLMDVYENKGVTIYAVPGRLSATEGGYFVPVPNKG